MKESIARTMDVIKGKALAVHCLLILTTGFSEAPAHLSEYEEMADSIRLLIYSDISKDATLECRALQSILVGLGRGEPGHFKTWTDITLERLESMASGKTPGSVELVEVKLYLEEFRKYLNELSATL